MSKFVFEGKDEVGLAANNLNDLIDLIGELHGEAEDGGSVDRRIDSLLWIARDLARGVADALEEKGRASK